MEEKSYEYDKESLQKDYEFFQEFHDLLKERMNERYKILNDCIVLILVIDDEQYKCNLQTFLEAFIKYEEDIMSVMEDMLTQDEINDDSVSGASDSE